jgi:hypothetical protein
MWQLNYNSNHIKPRSNWSILFLLLMGVALVYPFYHLHHIHAPEKAAPIIGFHYVGADTDHAYDHHSEDENTHSNDHRHKFDNHVDWQIFRHQSTNSSLNDDEFIEQDGLNLCNPEQLVSRINLFERQQPSELHTFVSTIRGPPRLA